MGASRGERARSVVGLLTSLGLSVPGATLGACSTPMDGGMDAPSFSDTPIVGTENPPPPDFGVPDATAEDAAPDGALEEDAPAPDDAAADDAAAGDAAAGDAAPDDAAPDDDAGSAG